VSYQQPTPFPNLVQILPFTGEAASVGTWTNANDSSCIFSGYRANGAQNDSITWHVPVTAGTWKVQVVHTTNSNFGIVTVSIGGTVVGTIDTYAAVLARNVVGEIAGVVVPDSGLQALRLSVPTKNASSSNYIVRLQSIALVRTG
jgi:hypothetical protein